MLGQAPPWGTTWKDLLPSWLRWLLPRPFSKNPGVHIKDRKCGLTCIPCLVFLCCPAALLCLHRVRLLGLHLLWLLLHCSVGLCVPPNTWWDHHKQPLTLRGTLPHKYIKNHSVLSKRPPKKTPPQHYLLLWACSLFHSLFPLSSAFSKALLTCLSLNIDFVLEAKPACLMFSFGSVPFS